MVRDLLIRIYNSLYYKYDQQRVKRAFVRHFFKNKKEFQTYYNEIANSTLHKKIVKLREIFFKNYKGYTKRGYPYSFGGVQLEQAFRIYCLVRKFKPKILVETGVCNGVSTAFILEAIYKNKCGHLVSIDYPEVADQSEQDVWEGKRGAVIPADKSPGWIIPEYLKKNWKLIIGKSQDKLPPLLKKYEEIDFFMHDSEHSYSCMIFEFKTTYKYLKEGGLLLADDIGSNSAFRDFLHQKNKSYQRVTAGLGIIVK